MVERTTLYDANLAAFKKRYGVVADYVDNLDTRAYMLCAARSGESYLRIKTSPGKEVLLGDADDPRAAAGRLLPAPHDRPALFLVMGMGLGYLLFEARKAFPNARFIVVEPEAHVFKRAISTFDFTPFFNDPHCAFAVALDAGILPRFFINFFSQGDNHMYLPTVALLQDRAVVHLTPDFYLRAGELFSQAVNDFWSHGTGNTYTDALIGLDYVLKNFAQMDRLHSFDAFAGLCRDRIGIVVASGPSLDTKLEQLREIQDQAVLVCADSALKKLLDSGIKPFGVACLERDDINAELFDGYAIPTDVALFAPALVKPSLVSRYPGPVVTMFRHSYPFYWVPPLLPFWDIGSSCAHLAFQTLNMLGCRRIALVGQDLAYDRRTGTSHYSGVIPFASEQFGAMDRITAPDHDGNAIATTDIWQMFRNIFSDLIAVQRLNNVVNVIERDRGLAIPGAPQLDPDTFFDDVRREKSGNPRLDPAVGRDALAGKQGVFLSELGALVKTSSAELRQARAGIAAFAAAQNVAEYLDKRNSVLRALSSGSRNLLDELWRPHQRRFEAAAFALWSSEEFLSQIGAYTELALRIIDELITVLENTRI